MLEWNTLLIDCSSQRGEHPRNWHIRSISNGSRNNSSTRSQRVSIPRHLFVISATITRDPGMLEWNTLLIDCFSQRGEHLCNWHIPDLSLMVLKIIQVKVPAGFNSSTSYCHISNNNSRSMHVRVKHSINRLFLSRGEHFRNWHIWSISNGSRIIQAQGPSGFQFLDIFKLYQQQ